jgi:hypothetical protein
MARTKEVLAFPHGLLFRMVAPLHLKELYSLSTGDMVDPTPWSDALDMTSLPRAVSLSRQTTSKGAFKHFFSCDTWKMS